MLASASQLVNKFIDPAGSPAEALRRLIELHGGRYDSAQGLAGLRQITQDLWFPKKGDQTIKVSSMTPAEINQQYDPVILSESWAAIDELGFRTQFVPRFGDYAAVFAHGTKPVQAQANFNLLAQMSNQGIKLGEDIFLLSACCSVPEDEAQKCKIPATGSQPPSEIFSMLHLWQHLREPEQLRRMKEWAISSSDSATSKGERRSPDTLDSLEAMALCCWRIGDGMSPAKSAIINLFKGMPVLNLACSQHQLLRQNAVTEHFLKGRRLDVQVDTIVAPVDRPQYLFLYLREVAALVWAIAQWRGVPLP